MQVKRERANDRTNTRDRTRPGRPGCRLAADRDALHPGRGDRRLPRPGRGWTRTTRPTGGRWAVAGGWDGRLACVWCGWVLTGRGAARAAARRRGARRGGGRARGAGAGAGATCTNTTLLPGCARPRARGPLTLHLFALSPDRVPGRGGPRFF